jgi:NADPH:quinone reductase-like Zn-dependent oxidoreductase
MKAAGFSEAGGPEVLRLMEVPEPHAGDGQVRVRVRAAGVQPYDAAVRAGWTPPGVDSGFPRVPGNEFAGVVDEDPSGDWIGAEVIGFGRLGAYAEFVMVPVDQVAGKPPGMPWEVAGGFSAGAQTAHIALREIGVGKGDTLVVHGAAGAVGTVAVQLAVGWGATVIGTAAEGNHEYLRSLGAVPVSYGDGLLERLRGYDVDAALDAAGGAALDASLEVVADRGRILTLVDHVRAGELGVKVTPDLRSAARLSELAGLYVEGRVRIHVRSRYPLERAADAHREIEVGHGRGKVVLMV